MSEGRKDDAGKLRFDLIPCEVEELQAHIFTMGAAKYEDRNWEKGIDYGRVYAAARRHMNEWLHGVHKDPESGLPHLAHAVWNLNALIYFDLYPEKYAAFNNLHRKD